ncbi:MAG: hypothetical protein SGPRY_007306 [Prymnesium sp.]
MLQREWRVFGVDIPCSATEEPSVTYDNGLTVSEPVIEALAERLGLGVDQLSPDQVKLVRRSLDARPKRSSRKKEDRDGGREVRWSYVLDVTLDAPTARKLKPQPGRLVPSSQERGKPLRRDAPAAEARHVLVVGAGPCGLFAALQLAQAGHRVTLCERGKPVEERGKSIGALIKRGKIDYESNFCYGEGGAGTWSDGKLTTRIGRNSHEVRRVLQTFVRFGAPERILLEGSPHLGTDNLVRMLKAFRQELLELGTEIRWNTRVDRFLLSDDCAGKGEGSPTSDRAVRGVVLHGGEQILADAVVLAAGHSARELYYELLRCGASVKPKDFAAPRRSVYSFCMCPGGQIVPTSLDVDHLCINGMSYSNRGSQWANSAVVEAMEARAAEMGGGGLVCPVQRVSDFLEGRETEGELPRSSYRVGVTAASLHQLYPPELTEALRQGIRKFAASLPGFDCDEALLHGVETRTSAPVQVISSSNLLEYVLLFNFLGPFFPS